MTDPVVSLDLDHVMVEPGGQASVTVTVRNLGSIVEGYRIEVVGEGVSQWVDVLPPEVSVYPQQEATAVVVFSPPGGAGAPGGTWPFGILVRSTEDADASAVAEGDLEIGKVFGLQAKLLPVNSSGRWNGRHVIQVTNWGNSPVTLKLSATDADQALGFMIRPETVEVPLGGTATARLWAKTKAPTLRGTPTRIPFTVTGERQGAPPPQAPPTPYGVTLDRPSVDGAFNQKPILTRGSVTAGVLALLLVVGAFAWVLTHSATQPATFKELGPPAKPKEVKVDTLSPESVRVSWAKGSEVGEYVISEITDDGKRSKAGSAEGTDTTTVIAKLTPATKVCFVVEAKRDDLTSPPSDEACGMTAEVAASPSPTGGDSGSPSATETGGSGSPTESGSPTSEKTTPSNPGTAVPPIDPSKAPTTPNPDFKGKWFAGESWDPAGSVYVPEDELAKLKALDERAGLVNSDDYPQMLPPIGEHNWVLYLGPFESQEDAWEACEIVKKVRTGCITFRLDP
ncbi:MAG: hypothetical protein QM650_09840 [Microlunatus sp.]